MKLSRLDELETLHPGDCPDDARIVILAHELRDFVGLVTMVRAAEAMRDLQDRSSKLHYDAVRPERD